MTVFDSGGAPVSNVTTANTFLEWVTMTNQLLTDGQDVANVMPDSTISISKVLEAVSREFYGLGTAQSPDFAGVTLTEDDWRKLNTHLDQGFNSANNFVANVVTFTGNVAVGGSDFTGARLTVTASGGIYLTVGANNVVIGETSYERLYDDVGTNQVLVSQTNNFIMGKLGIGTTTPNNALEVVGTMNANAIYDSNTLVYYSPGNPLTKNDIGLGNVPNAQQVPKTGGTFTGNVEFLNHTDINGNWLYEGIPIKSRLDNLSEFKYNGNNFSVSSQENSPQDLTFNSDGSRMYIIGSNNDTVYQYDLGTNFEVTTSVYNGNNFSVASEEGIPYGLEFNSDGSRMYVVGFNNKTVYQYDLGTNFDVTTSVYNGNNFNVNSQATNPNGLAFNSNGSRMYIVGGTNDTVYQYDLGTNFDVTTSVYNGNSFSVGSQTNSPTSLTFNGDGSKMYVIGNDNDTVYQYDLGTNFDVTTSVYNGDSFNVASEDGNPHDLKFNSDGSRMYVFGFATVAVYQYDRNIRLIV